MSLLAAIIYMNRLELLPNPPVLQKVAAALAANTPVRRPRKLRLLAVHKLAKRALKNKPKKLVSHLPPVNFSKFLEYNDLLIDDLVLGLRLLADYADFLIESFPKSALTFLSKAKNFLTMSKNVFIDQRQYNTLFKRVSKSAIIANLDRKKAPPIFRADDTALKGRNKRAALLNFLLSVTGGRCASWEAEGVQVDGQMSLKDISVMEVTVAVPSSASKRRQAFSICFPASREQLTFCKQFFAKNIKDREILINSLLKFFNNGRGDSDSKKSRHSWRRQLAILMRIELEKRGLVKDGLITCETSLRALNRHFGWCDKSNSFYGYSADWASWDPKVFMDLRGVIRYILSGGN
jgi:hypothetical protein